MASHLTISVELIAFMKWVLRNKRAALNSFLASVMDEQLCAEIDRIIHEPKELSGDELYSIVNSFLGHIEAEMISHLESDEPPAEASEDTEALYHSLSPQMQAQLTQAFGDDVLSQGVSQAATLLNENGEAQDVQSEQVKKHALMRSLLNTWSPLGDDEVN